MCLCISKNYSCLLSTNERVSHYLMFNIPAWLLQQRITIPEVIENEWFRKGYKPPTFEQADISLDDVDAIFNETGVSKVQLGISKPSFKQDLHIALDIQVSGNLVVERKEERPAAPLTMNAFELISKSQGLNLSSLFEKQMVCFPLVLQYWKSFHIVSLQWNSFYF